MLGRRGLALAVACAAAAGSGSAALAEASTPAAGDRHIVVYRNSVLSVDQETAARELAQGFRADLLYRNALKGFAARLSPGQVDALRADPEVAFVTLDRAVRAAGVNPIVPGDEVPPGIRRIGAASATTARDASGVNVAVLDTGIDLSHPDLNAVNGTNCISSGPAQDTHGHGTHVSGSIAAKNNGAGVVGTAPGTKLYAVKVLAGAGSTGTWSTVICGIDWVTGTRSDGDPGNDVAVANLAVGGPGDPVQSCPGTADPLHLAICNSTAAGVTYVVAAGNYGEPFDSATNPSVPAAYPEVLAVTAMSDDDGEPGGLGETCGYDDDRYASFSSYAVTAAGENHTIAAPGACVRSTWEDGEYDDKSGTSMAAGHVAGAVALCLKEGASAGPCSGMSPAGIIQRIRADAAAHASPTNGFAGDPSSPVGPGYFGYLTWVNPPGVGSSEGGGTTTSSDSIGGNSSSSGGTSPSAVSSAERAVQIVSPKRARLRLALRRGLGVKVSSTRPGVFVSQARLALRTAKSLGLRARSVVAGRAARSLTQPGTVKLRVRFTSEARRAFRSARTVRVSLVTTFTDTAGNVTRARARVTLVR